MNGRKVIIDKIRLIFNRKLISNCFLNTSAGARFNDFFKRNNKRFLQYLNSNYYYNNYNRAKSKRFLFTTYCTAAFYHKFSWDDYRIRNDELKNYVREILREFGKTEEIAQVESQQSINENQSDSSWERIFSRHDLVIWRRMLVESNDEQHPAACSNHNQNSSSSNAGGIFEYKVFGRLFDVSSIDFFRTQIDLDYRKKWDHLVVKLQILNTDKKYKDETSELIQWIMKFPFPMNSREYIFIRRFCVEPEKGLLVLLSTSLTKPNIYFDFKDDDNAEDEFTEAILSHHLPGAVKNEGDKKKHIAKIQPPNSPKVYEQPHQQAPYVRVTRYKSNMIIVPHKKNAFHENGLDFYLNYYDDPKARIPNMAYKWMATSGLPDWLDKLHKAAKNIPKPSKNIDIMRDYELFYLSERPPPQPPSEAETAEQTVKLEETDNNVKLKETVKKKISDSSGAGDFMAKKKRIQFDIEPHSFFIDCFFF